MTSPSDPSPEDTSIGASFGRLFAQREQAHRDELQRLQLQHQERARQLETSRLHAEDELEALEERLAELDERQRAEASRLNAELTQAREAASNGATELATLAAKLEHAKSLQQDLRERLQAEQGRAMQERQRLLKEKAALADKLAHVGSERDLFHQAMVAAEQRLVAAESGFLHELGRRLALGFTSWRGFIRLPWAIGMALTQQRRQAEALLGQVDAVLANQGPDAAEDWARRVAVDPASLATGLTRLARPLFALDPARALALAEEAVRLDPRPFRRKWLAFMRFDAGAIDAAHALLDSLPEGVDFKSSEKNKAEYIAGCQRLLRQPPALPEVASAPVYAPLAHRILYVMASALPYHVNGYTLRSHALVKALREQGLDVVCVTRPGYPADRADRQVDATVDDVQIDGIRYHTLTGPHRRKLGLDQYLLQSAELVLEHARRERPAAIHAASNYEAALPALMAARRLGIPFTYEVRGLWEYTSAAKRPGWEGSERFQLERQLETLVARHADRVLTLSQALADELVARGVEPSRIRLAPNAVDPAQFQPVPRNPALAATLGLDADDFVVGYVGSLVAYEGLDDLIEAMALLRTRLPHARALIVGDGDALPVLRQRVHERELEGRVVFAGRVAPQQVREHYALINVVALPRKPATVCQLVPPIKPLEAMALGIPLVVADVGALRELVRDGSNGLLHLAGNARSLADCIEVLARQPELARRLAEQARQDVLATHTWQHVAGQVHASYRDLLPMLPAAHASAESPGTVTLPEIPPAAPTPEPAVTETTREDVDLEPIAVASGKHVLEETERQRLDAKLERALRQGPPRLLEFLEQQTQGHSNRLAAFCHLRAAQAGLDAGHDALATQLARQALALDSTATTLRGAARVQYNAADIDGAATAVDALEQALGQPKPGDRRFIDEVRGRAQLAAWAALPAQARAVPATPRRVLNILAFSLPYTSVGYATRSHGLAVGIRNAGWDIRPYTRPGFPLDFKPELADQTLPEQDEIDGIVYRRILDFNRKEMNEVEYMHAAIAHYERVIRAESPQLVHAASNYVTALPALIAARRLGVPFVYEVRGFWEVTRSSRDEQFTHSAKYRFMQLFEALTARHADHVITITGPMRDELMARGVPAERISIAYNSVDPERFVPRPPNRELAATLGLPEGIPVIGYVGSFVDYEGLDDLVSACAGLKAEGLAFRLLLVGDGVVLGDIRRQVEDMGLSDHTVITGRVPHEQVEDYYSLIDIAPFPRKPWPVCELVSPLKPFEAMALEKTVIVSSTRAMREIVRHSETGVIFEKGNVIALQKALGELLSDRQRYVAIGKQSRRWIREQRSWNASGLVCVSAYG